MACNSCNDEYQKFLLEGRVEKISIRTKTENCPSCQAPPRFKTFRLIFEQSVLPLFSNPPKMRNALLVSATKRWEQDIIRPHVANMTSTALYGEYGADTVASDLRDLKEIGSQQFDLVYACGVLDFIYEIDDVLESVARVLKPNGIFLFHILEHRLVSGYAIPKINGSKKEPYFPKDVELPSVVFGKKDVVRRLGAHGFKPSMHKIVDVFSGDLCTWFIGKKSGT